MSYARTAVTRMTLDMRRPDLQRSETVTLGESLAAGTYSAFIYFQF